MRVSTRVEDGELVLEVKLPELNLELRFTKQELAKIIKDLTEFTAKNANPMESLTSPSENISEGSKDGCFLEIGSGEEPFSNKLVPVDNSVDKSPPKTKRGRPPFQAPTLEQARIYCHAYCKEKNYNVSSDWIDNQAEQIWSWYESVGWTRQRKKMQNWKLAFAGWILREMAKREKGNGRKRHTAYDEVVEGLRNWRRDDLDR